MSRDMRDIFETAVERVRAFDPDEIGERADAAQAWAVDRPAVTAAGAAGLLVATAVIVLFWKLVLLAAGVVTLGYLAYRYPVVEWARAVTKEGGDAEVPPWLEEHWLTGVLVVLGVGLAYGFYLSLSLRLAGLWVAFGSFLFFVVGLGVFVGAPFLVGRQASWGLRHRMFRIYGWLCQQALGRGQLVKREHAGVELCASVWDGDHGSEQVKLDGEWRDFEDVGDRMRYLKSGGAFGIIDEASTLIIDPVDAALGARRKAIIEAGEEVVDFGRGFGECVREHAHLPARAPLVDPRDATHLLGGNAKPTDAAATEEFEIKAWADEQQVPMGVAMTMAGLFAVTVLVIYLFISFMETGGSGGGSGPPGSEIISGTLPFIFWGLRR